MITTEPEYLDAVADYIETHGWVQKAWTRDGAVCIGQGFSNVARDHECDALSVDAFLHLEQALGMAPLIWNDVPGRTKQEVVDMLRERARTLRADEESDAREASCSPLP